jgi:glutathione S-transferase
MMRKLAVLGAVLSGASAAAWLLKQTLAKMGPNVPDVGPETLILYQFDYSPYCVKVRHILDFKKIPYQVVEITPLIHREFSRRQSGQVKVPYLRHGDQVICDSSAIALYLEATFPEPSLFPAEPALKEQVLLLEDWLDEGFQPALGKATYVHNYLNPQPLIDNPNLSTGIAGLDRYKAQIIPMMLWRNLKVQKLSPADLPALEKRAQEVLERIKALLQREYLVGDQLTLADISLMAHLYNDDKLPLLGPGSEYRWLIDWRDRRLAEIHSPVAQ